MMIVKIDKLEEGQTRIEKKLDKFIDTADLKYATKEELKDLREHNKEQDTKIEWNKTKIVDIFLRVATIATLLGLGGKSLGVF